MAGGRAGALLDLRRPALPEPGVAAVLRHRRLVADLRPHVPALRHAVRLRLDRQEHQRLRLHRRDPRRPVREAPRPPSTRPATSRACRATATTPARSAPTWASSCPHYAENFLAWWTDRLRPEIERNFAYLDGQDSDDASFAELAILLEDAIDIHDRHWKIHWMLNFAQFSATTAPQRRGRGGQGRGRPRAARAPAELGGRPQLGLDRGPLEAQGGDQGRRRAAGRLRRRRDRAGVIEALEGSERGRTFVAERIRPHQETFGYKAIWSHEFAFKTWVEDPGPIVEAIRGYLATDYDYPSNIQRVRDDLEAAKAEVMEGVEGEQRETLQGALDRSLAMNPLTPDHHFFIDQGTNARLRLAADRDRPQADRGGRPRRRRGRRLPALQRGPPAAGRPVGARRPRAGLRPPRRARGRRREAARRRGSAPRPRRRSPSPTRRCGASRRSSTPASRRRPAR